MGCLALNVIGPLGAAGVMGGLGLTNLLESVGVLGVKGFLRCCTIPFTALLCLLPAERKAYQHLLLFDIHENGNLCSLQMMLW